MRAPDGRPFVRDSIGEQLRAGRKTDDVLDRKLSRQAKPVASSFPIGQTRATAGSLDQGNTTQSAITGTDWTFTTAGGDGPTVLTNSGGILNVKDAGCYMFATTLRGGWSSPAVPAWFQVSADYDGNTGEFPRWRRSPNTNDSNFNELFVYGPWYLAAGAGVFFGAEWLTGDVFFLDALTIEVTLLG